MITVVIFKIKIIFYCIEMSFVSLTTGGVYVILLSLFRFEHINIYIKNNN